MAAHAIPIVLLFCIVIRIYWFIGYTFILISKHLFCILRIFDQYDRDDSSVISSFSSQHFCEYMYFNIYIYLLRDKYILRFYGHYSKLDECNKGCNMVKDVKDILYYSKSVFWDYEIQNPIRYHVRALQSSTVDNREHCYKS